MIVSELIEIAPAGKVAWSPGAARGDVLRPDPIRSFVRRITGRECQHYEDAPIGLLGHLLECGRSVNLIKIVASAQRLEIVILNNGVLYNFCHFFLLYIVQ